MKKLSLFVFVVVTVQCYFAHGASFEDEFHEHMLSVGWKQSIAELDRYSASEQRYILERALLAFGSDSIPRQAERQANFDKAQSTLLAIPGHAKYYQEKVDKMRDELLANSKLSQEERIKMQDEGQTVLDEPVYLSDVGLAIRTLKYLPSAETVSVLGYFLNDPVLRDGKTLLGNRLIPGDYTGHVSNAQLATEVIRQLGIEQPPFRDIKGMITPEEIDAWKDWWNEIKAGKRTYRFTGSNIEYGPDGPANAKAIQHNELNRKRDEERSEGRKRALAASETTIAENQTKKPFSIAGIIAACLVVAGAVWYFLRGKEAA